MSPLRAVVLSLPHLLVGAALPSSHPPGLAESSKYCPQKERAFLREGSWDPGRLGSSLTEGRINCPCSEPAHRGSPREHIQGLLSRQAFLPVPVLSLKGEEEHVPPQLTHCPGTTTRPNRPQRPGPLLPASVCVLATPNHASLLPSVSQLLLCWKTYHVSRFTSTHSLKPPLDNHVFQE